MQYRMKYIFKGTRDKGIEIMDAHGDYQSYELLQEGVEETEDTYLEAEAPKTNINYEMKFNPQNKQKRKIAREDVEHQIMDVYVEQETDTSKAGFIGGVWVTKNEPMYDYDNNPPTESLGKYIVGTELANFLNFDIDRFMNGGYSLLWKSNEENLQETLVGWIEKRGINLDNLIDRRDAAMQMALGTMEENATKSIPYFIRMFGCKFINTQTWEYDMQEVEYIKSLQQRIKIFCEKVFFPEDDNDKRTHFERYCANIENIDKKELRKKVPKDWITPPNIEQALSYECYAMIKGNVNLFKCENCGLYTVSNDNRARLCSRPVYDGTESEKVHGVLEVHEYRYLCKDEQYIKNTRMKNYSNIISAITDYEKKRLYHHLTTYTELYEFQDKLAMVFGDFVFDNAEKYQVMIEKAEDDGITIRIANEYMNVIAEEIDKFIKSAMGIGMKDKFLFKRKKNTAIKSLTGNIFE